jgi:hypothetical protein
MLCAQIAANRRIEASSGQTPTRSRWRKMSATHCAEAIERASGRIGTPETVSALGVVDELRALPDVLQA